MNLGPQPTVDPTSPSAVEVHLLDKELDLLGIELKIEPVKRIRFQQKFQILRVTVFGCWLPAHSYPTVLQ